MPGPAPIASLTRLWNLRCANAIANCTQWSALSPAHGKWHLCACVLGAVQTYASVLSTPCECVYRWICRKQSQFIRDRRILCNRFSMCSSLYEYEYMCICIMCGCFGKRLGHRKRRRHTVTTILKKWIRRVHSTYRRTDEQQDASNGGGVGGLRRGSHMTEL